MGSIYLIRHGEVQGNRPEGRTYVGWSDLPLTPRGEKQAKAAAAWLAEKPISAVYSSDLQRARCTAEQVASKHGLGVTGDPSWREANYGAWEGLGETELREQWGDHYQRRQADPQNVAPPEGESGADLWARLNPAWEQVVATHRDDDVVVVSHNGALRLLLCHLLGAPPSNYRLVQLDNGGISTVRLSTEVGPPTIGNINQTCHLKGI